MRCKNRPNVNRHEQLNTTMTNNSRNPMSNWINNFHIPQCPQYPNLFPSPSTMNKLKVSVNLQWVYSNFRCVFSLSISLSLDLGLTNTNTQLKTRNKKRQTFYSGGGPLFFGVGTPLSKQHKQPWSISYIRYKSLKRTKSRIQSCGHLFSWCLWRWTLIGIFFAFDDWRLEMCFSISNRPMRKLKHSQLVSIAPWK